MKWLPSAPQALARRLQTEVLSVWSICEKSERAARSLTGFTYVSNALLSPKFHSLAPRSRQDSYQSVHHRLC